ncbi:MAG: MFS transporter [Candidatus Delongbacteria bacterium]
MNGIYSDIKKDIQIAKFSAYGFFKNLKFFEPFLIIFLMQSGLNLFQIGLLYSVREAMSFIFEVPSGIFADNYGKKRELMWCFSFYIISFIIFFLGSGFFVFSVAMIFFGLGEAFRSGTHKAMIYTYLEHKNWFAHKNFVYGRTRSFSMLGSALSSVLSVIFLFKTDAIRSLFLISVMPYILDMFLIMSYPSYLDEGAKKSFSFTEFIRLSIESVKKISKNSPILKTITSSSFFDAVFGSVKDYIQPIMATLIAGISLGKFLDLDRDQSLKISLAAVYMVIYIISAYASKNIYKLNTKRSSSVLMTITMNIFALTMMIIALAVKFEMIYIVTAAFLFMFVLKNLRRPIFVDAVGDMMAKDERATVLSVENQMTALFTIFLAPVFGYIADRTSFAVLFVFISIMIFLTNIFAKVPEVKK